MATDTIRFKDINQEAEEAQTIARRYCFDFVDLKTTKIDHELFRTVPVDLMFRYHFVPLQAHNGTLEIALSDPRQIVSIDELAVLLSKKLKIKVATYSQISDLLKKTEQSQRVLEEVTEGFTLDVVGDDENADENLSIDRLTSDEGNIAPVIKLVDTTIFNALERRASDIHIETRDQELAIKYRIDGVLQYAMSPIAKEWYSAVISRIKVMSELDIAERRVPQDGRFRVRYKGRLIDFRVSIMPTIHGEDAVLRVLDKESMSEKFSRLTLDVGGFAESDIGAPRPKPVRKISEHASLDLRQYVAHQAVSAGALAGTRLAYDGQPEMRRFHPPRCRLGPAGIPDQCRCRSEQRSSDIVGRARRRVCRARDPLCPSRPESLNR